jgi:RNA polymerase sigma-70 factor, ECF subfamily
MDCEACTPAHILWPRNRKGVDGLTGEDADFSSLVHRRTRLVFRIAYAVLLNSHDAEDAVQETFLKLYRNKGWRHAENEQAFLARVAWRVAIDARRRSTSQLNQYTAPPLDSDPPAPQPGPESILLAADRHAVVHAAIDSLPEELRVPLVLSSFEELNSREIGRILGVPEGTVRTRLLRARRMLRHKLAGLEETRYA